MTRGMPCSAAISSSRSPNAPLAITSSFLPGGTTDEIDISIAAVPEPVMQQHLVRGRRAEHRPQLLLQAPDDRRVVAVAVADVVVHERRLHARRGHHRSRAEEHVARADPSRRAAARSAPACPRAGDGARRLHRRARQLVAVDAQQPLGVQLHLGACRRPATAWCRRRAPRPGRARRRPPRPRSATADRQAARARRPATATSRTDRRSPRRSWSSCLPISATRSPASFTLVASSMSNTRDRSRSTPSTVRSPRRRHATRARAPAPGAAI